MFLPIVEGLAFDIVDEGFAGLAFGEDQFVAGQFDMVIGEAFRDVVFAGDAGVVQQGRGLDEDTVQRDGVIGGEQQVAPWQTGGEASGADADGQGAGFVAEAG